MSNLVKSSSLNAEANAVDDSSNSRTYGSGRDVVDGPRGKTRIVHNVVDRFSRRVEETIDARLELLPLFCSGGDVVVTLAFK